MLHLLLERLPEIIFCRLPQAIDYSGLDTVTGDVQETDIAGG
jgi:hypothetical protein